MSILEKKLELVKNKIPQDIENGDLYNILFDMNRYFDKQFVEDIHGANIKLNQNARNQLRTYYYYGTGSLLDNIGIEKFSQYKASDKDKINILTSFEERYERYDKNKIVMSIIERFKNLNNDGKDDKYKSWLKYYNKKVEKNFDFSLFIYDYSQEQFVKDEYNLDNILKVIANIYDKLENYRKFVFKLNGKLFDKNNEDVTWKILYKIGIYCENFIQYEEEFFPFKQKERIQELTDFLYSRFPNYDNSGVVYDFYKSISTGFKFEDCLISDEQKNIILVYQKIRLDKSPVPCPVCMTTIQSGNSFPELFLRSYECKNESCSQRSKSGRGKRFDEYGTYRYFKMVENKKTNMISDELMAKWRRDIFSSEDDIYEMLLKYYAWDNEKVCVTSYDKIRKSFDRKIVEYQPYSSTDYNYKFEKLPICIFFDEVSKCLSKKTGTKILSKDINIINGNSTIELESLKPGQIGVAITSPPYYNAREYSQWQNMIMYYVDMMCNCNSVYKSMVSDGYYLYNIGDIVNTDNIYVKSNMSKKRLQLGFLSCLVFEKAGYNLVGNIIWDKGEVQSKRNSTINRNSGYVRCINCYEHVLIFKKGNDKDSYNDVVRINPVIKINSKGENTYKHTAPYPLELVELIRPFVKLDKYVLDSYLGSGTTLKWCKKNNFKGIGFELNKEYYNLAKKYINESCQN